MEHRLITAEAKKHAMALTRIIVADCIMAAHLFAEEGYDVGQSADNLADIRGQVIVDSLEELYPGVEVCADIAIEQNPGPSRPLEVMAYIDEEQIDQAQSVAIRDLLTRRLNEAVADLSWAVRLD